MKSRNSKLIALFITGCVAIVAIAVVVGLSATKIMGNSKEIHSGVTISGLDVGGMDKEQADKALADYMEKLRSRQVKILIEQEEIVTDAEELGFSCEEGDTLDKAYELGKGGGLFAGGDLKDEEKALNVSVTVDEAILKKYVEEHCTQFNVEKKNSKLKLVNGKFKATKSRNGKQLQVEETVQIISSALQNKLSADALEVTAVVKTLKPKYTQKQVARCQDLLGRYSTSYSSSAAPRKNNVQVAAKYINGTIVYPGKTFSVVKTIKDRTEENGYQAAPEYSSGTVVDGIGGGVCQVSTTLYNAVINAELEIVERSPHSMVVAYVDVSRDAAIAGDYKDFKFKNNTDVPVYIAATADGSTLSFRIYGEETRPENRKIEFKPEVLETIQPGEAITTVDVSKPASYRSVTQSAHVGYRAKLWKIVYEDGKEKERIQLNSSSYNAEPEHVVIGKQAESQPTASPTTAPEETKKPKVTPKPKPKATKKPVVTKKPTPTKKPEVTPAPVETPAPTEVVDISDDPQENE